MGMTIAEKILAGHSAKNEVKPGEYIWARIDGTALSALGRASELLEKLGVKKLFDPDLVYAVEDHLAPPPNTQVANEMA